MGVGRRTQRSVRSLGWIYVFAIGLWFCLRLIFRDRVWWLALINTFTFYLFTPLLIFIPLAIGQAIGQRQKRLLIGLAMPVILLCSLFGQQFLPNWNTTKPNHILLKLMSFNLRWDNENYAAIARSIRTANPDVIGLQEMRPHHGKMLRQNFPDYPYFYFQQTPEFHNVGILSRHPIRSVQTLTNAVIERGFQAELLIQNQPVKVIVTHLAPNNMPFWPPTTLAHETKQRYTQRQAQVASLQQTIGQNYDPTIMLCDCNMSDTSDTYQAIKTVLRDSFAETGWGLGFTIRRDNLPVPLSRIDYVWHSDAFQSVSSQVGTDGGSDHWPIVAQLALAKPTLNAKP
jgi:vancomycin resistance protein VanJ